MGDYVKILLDLLSGEGLEYEIKKWTDGNNALIYVQYETDDGEVYTVHVICSDKLFILRTKGEEDISFSDAGLDYVNYLNQTFLGYRFILNMKGYTVIERARAVDQCPGFVSAAYVLNEIKSLCKVREELCNI